MKFALYGNDIDETTNPLEAGLGWVVKPARATSSAAAPSRRCARAASSGSSSASRWSSGPCRATATRSLHDGRAVGAVTSGSFGPSVERGIGMAYVPTALAAVGTELAVEIRGRAEPARVAKTPFPPSRTKKS